MYGLPFMPLREYRVRGVSVFVRELRTWLDCVRPINTRIHLILAVLFSLFCASVPTMQRRGVASFTRFPICVSNQRRAHFIPIFLFQFFTVELLDPRVSVPMSVLVCVCECSPRIFNACLVQNLWFCTTCAWLGINYRLHKFNIYSNVLRAQLHSAHTHPTQRRPSSAAFFRCWYSCSVHSLRSLDFHRMHLPDARRVRCETAVEKKRENNTLIAMIYGECTQNDNYSPSKNSRAGQATAKKFQHSKTKKKRCRSRQPCVRAVEVENGLHEALAVRLDVKKFTCIPNRNEKTIPCALLGADPYTQTTENIFVKIAPNIQSLAAANDTISPFLYILFRFRH